MPKRCFKDDHRVKWLVLKGLWVKPVQWTRNNVNSVKTVLWHALELMLKTFFSSQQITCQHGSKRKRQKKIDTGITCYSYSYIYSLVLWSKTQFLEGHSPVQFSSNQLQLTPTWKLLGVLLIILKFMLPHFLAFLSSSLWPGNRSNSATLKDIWIL